MQDELDQLRRKILDHALGDAPFDGWTDQMLERAVAAAGVDVSAFTLAFPSGVADALDFWADQSDQDMLARFAEAPVDEMRIRDKATFVVRARLEVMAAHKEAAARAAHTLALPHHAALAARLTWRTADRMWRAIGDRSTDFNYYSKRTILSAVYASTFAVWLRDETAGAEKTWAFLDRRIGDVMTFEKFKAQVKKSPLAKFDPIAALSKLRYGLGR